MAANCKLILLGGGGSSLSLPVQKKETFREETHNNQE